MLVFHAGTPFPLMEEGEYTYAEAQAHAERVDDWLGLSTYDIETELERRGCISRAPNSGKERQQLWIGLATQNLLTPYVEIRTLLHRLNLQEGQTIVDLGAAYGRIGFVVGRHYPDVQFIGYEFVGERLKEAKTRIDRFGYKNVRLEHADLSSPDFTPAEADYYFIYDYGKARAIEKTLYDLKKIAAGRPIKVIARGPTCPTTIASRHSWLTRLVKCGRSTVFMSRE